MLWDSEHPQYKKEAKRGSVFCAAKERSAKPEDTRRQDPPRAPDTADLLIHLAHRLLLPRAQHTLVWQLVTQSGGVM